MAYKMTKFLKIPMGKIIEKILPEPRALKMWAGIVELYRSKE